MKTIYIWYYTKKENIPRAVEIPYNEKTRKKLEEAKKKGSQGMLVAFEAKRDASRSKEFEKYKIIIEQFEQNLKNN